MKTGKLFVVSAPSGSGKTTLCNKLLEDGLGLANSVSMTTRLPRPGETGGVDYRFVTRKKFLGLVKTGGFLEHENNFGHLYGTPKSFIEKNLGAGKDVLLSIDVKGAMKVRRQYPKDSVLIFIRPPSIAVLKKRLLSRRSEDEQTIARRLGIAKKEMAYRRKYDYCIVNDRLTTAYKKLKNIILSELSTK
jgi:guanylate kinase